MMHRHDEDDLVVLRNAASVFEARLMVAMLADADIPATAADHAMSAFSFSLSYAEAGIPVLVRAADRDRANLELEKRWRESVDIDWDEFDPGEREDNLPLNEPGRVPPAAQFSFVIVLLALLSMIVLAVASVIW